MLDEAYRAWRASPGEETLARLHSALYKRALKTIRSLLWQDRPDLASDAASDTIMRIRQFKGGSAFSTWAYKIAKNVALMEVRKRDYRDQDQLIDGDAVVADEEEETEWPSSIIQANGLIGSLTPREQSLLQAITLGDRPSEWASSEGFSRTTGWRVWKSLRKKLLAWKRKQT